MVISTSCLKKQRAMIGENLVATGWYMLLDPLNTSAKNDLQIFLMINKDES